MAKLGLEVEGRFKGIKTIFVDVIEMAKNGGADKVKALATERQVSHIYISDRHNILNYAEVGEWFAGYMVTLDVTSVLKALRPPNVTLILTMPHKYWESVANLGPQDQVKFHSEDRDVLCAPLHSFVPTHPSEFEADVEL